MGTGGEDGRRVLITGIGIVGPTGIGTQAFWQSLTRGQSGIQRISRFDPTGYPSQIAGEVRDRAYEQLIDPRKLRTTTHVTQLALAATELALLDARIDTAWQEPDMVGTIMGTALGGLREAEQQHAILMERGARRVNPFIANASPNYAVGAEIASAVNARGDQVIFSTGCPSSLQAIGHAAALVASGDLDVCVAGGAESPLIPTVIAGMSRTQELSTHNDEPERASRPFDRQHAGLVLSEGSCVLVLESAEHAARRSAQPYAQILGSASSCDARGLYGLDASGEQGARAVLRALTRSGLSFVDVDYVCSHANSSPSFDRKETGVIMKAFGNGAPRLLVSSIKGIIGHPFGASGAFQTAATALTIRHQLILPTHNLEEPDPECHLNHVLGEPLHAHVRNALITSYGYGGVNAFLLLGEQSS